MLNVSGVRKDEKTESIIGEEIISLEPKPQEYTTEIDHPVDEKTSLTVYRLDFAAKIKTPEGQKLIIIEMQKASVPADIKRFRMYLGNQYADASNSVEIEDGIREPLRIYTIYFLGKDLAICDTPVLSVFPEIRDVATQQVVEGNSRFIELLNHKCWIVQINCLKKRRRNDLEMLLSVFDQENRSKDHHIMNVNEDDFPEKYRPLIRRLKMAASSPEIKKQMQDEDEVWEYLKDVERIGRQKGRKDGLKEMEGIVAQKDKELEEKGKELEEKDKELEEKDKELEEKDKEIEALKQQLVKVEQLKKQK
jgi:hypothetical protein